MGTCTSTCERRLAIEQTKDVINRYKLNMAILRGNTNAVREMIMTEGRELDINSTENKWELPLHLAVRLEDIEMTRMLLSYGANVNGMNSDLARCTTCNELSGLTQHPIVLAASLGDMSLVTLLLERGANPNAQAQERIGRRPMTKTALHYAVNQGNVDMVKILLQHGAITDLIDYDGNTVFHCAVQCSRMLEEEGIITRPSRKDFAGDNICQEHVEILELLCRSTYRGSITSLLNVQNNERFTALFLAIGYRCKRSVCVLLNVGADPNAYLDGMLHYGTPLHAAVFTQEDDIIQNLVQNGSNLNVTNAFGNTPLYLSILYCTNEEVITKLIVHGSDSNVSTECSNNTLIQLCMKTRMEDCSRICHLLVYAGSKVYGTNWQRPFDKHVTDEDLRDWLREMSYTPNTLQSLSRIAIRKFLIWKVHNGKSIVKTILTLPLPKYLTEYLLLKDIVSIRMLN